MSRRLPHILDDDAPEALLRATTRQRDRVLGMVLLYAGLRVAELCALEVGHLDFRRKLLWVRGGKGDKDRCLPIPTALLGPLRGWVGARRAGHVFPSPYGGPLTTRAVQKLIKRLAVAAGLPDPLAPRKYHPHALRRVMATRMLERGADIIAVRDALGHASVATTQVYTCCSPQRLREAMEV